MDYEVAQINSFRKIFGQNTVFGCLVHYIRAMTLHLKTMSPKLYKQYIEETKISTAWIKENIGQKPITNIRNWVSGAHTLINILCI